MTTPRTTSGVNAWPWKGLSILITLLLCFSLFCCSSPFKKPPATREEALAEAAEDRKKDGPQPGDVRVINGMEWVYGRNVKYMNTMYEPLFVWLPREVYTPSTSDTMPGRVGYPIKKTKETMALEERLAKLEAQVRGTPPPKAPAPEQPIKDASGKAWIRYFRNDDGVDWFVEEGTPAVSGNTITLWRKRTFPAWAFQKELVTLDDINCRQVQYRTRELRVVNQDGTSQTFDKVTPWAKVFASSPEDYLMGEFCKQ
jgi:hypothetical protein